MQFRVYVSAMANMEAVVDVEADSKEEADKKVLDLAYGGNVKWNYNGVDDDTIEVDQVDFDGETFEIGNKVEVIGGWLREQMPSKQRIYGVIYDTFTCEDGEQGFRVQMDGSSFVIPARFSELDAR